jgi:hypothetical protein
MTRENAMLEDFRDHDPNPTVHERAWIEANPYPALFRVAIMAGVALIVGLAASEPAVNPATPSPVSTAARTAG